MPSVKRRINLPTKVRSKLVNSEIYTIRAVVKIGHCVQKQYGVKKAEEVTTVLMDVHLLFQWQKLLARATRKSDQREISYCAKEVGRAMARLMKAHDAVMVKKKVRKDS